MIAQIGSMFVGMYGAVGPGLILALALPVTLTALVVVVREGLRRTKSEESERATT